ncbi:unnamed protein product [Aspergillus oryzae var. brunneus]|uniref:Unnamed protein product n=1 Tax=Aspergillus oryzae var. brunneus TaxID=332754 RepID=A0ABQ6KDZ7_ASPOZ|nr:unnamed protein product [Aspergillus oryzae var. brunneus]
MPSISTTSKIEGTKAYATKVVFSGSTSTEREAVVAEVQSQTDAILIPPYDDFNIICGQGTTGLEIEEQYLELLAQNPQLSVHGSSGSGLDAVITPIGGGGLNAGVATFFSDKKTRCQVVDYWGWIEDSCGIVELGVFSDKKKVEGVFAVTEEQIKAAMRLVLERMKVVVEPSAVVGLAVCLFNEEFRRIVEREGGEEGWDIGIVFSGGNTTVEAIGKLFS